MKVSSYIILLAYYSFGSLFLPLGDFSKIGELPRMYAHCNATEDSDLNFPEFIADHLLGLSIFTETPGHHSDENGEREIPHQPYQFHNPVNIYVYNVSNPPEIASKRALKTGTGFPAVDDSHIFTGHVKSVFQPPDAS